MPPASPKTKRSNSSGGKFLVDMPLSPELAAWLVLQGHDAVHASALGLSRADDHVILQRAREEARVLVTADLDFPRLFAMTHAQGPGLILLREGHYTEQETIALVTRALATVSFRELVRSIVVVDHVRVRKTSLPL